MMEEPPQHQTRQTAELGRILSGRPVPYRVRFMNRFGAVIDERELGAVDIDDALVRPQTLFGQLTLWP